MITHGSTRVLVPGEALIHERQAFDFVYILLKGLLRVSVCGQEKDAVAELGAGEVVGEMSFVDARPPSATVTAIEKTVVLALSRQKLQQEMERSPKFAARFYKALSISLANRLREAQVHKNYRSGDSLELDVRYDDELDLHVLDHVHLAGARFEKLKQRLL